MADLRVRFVEAYRPEKDTLAFRVEGIDQEGKVVPGTITVTNPTEPWPPLAFTSELLPFGRELMCGVLAALNGPLKRTKELPIGEEMGTKADALVSEDPPPSLAFP